MRTVTMLFTFLAVSRVICAFLSPVLKAISGFAATATVRCYFSVAAT